MALDCEQVLQCLDEVERELFRVADHGEYQKFHKNSQLSAVLLLLLGASSLHRSMLRLVQVKDLEDGFHLFFPLMCVNPRKSNVSGLPSPLRFRFCSANLPNSIRRVLSGCSSDPNFPSRSCKFSKKRSASVWC
jgi:hypothetical protein